MKIEQLKRLFNRYHEKGEEFSMFLDDSFLVKHMLAPFYARLHEIDQERFETSKKHWMEEFNLTEADFPNGHFSEQMIINISKYGHPTDTSTLLSDDTVVIMKCKSNECCVHPPKPE